MYSKHIKQQKKHLHKKLNFHCTKVPVNEEAKDQTTDTKETFNSCWNACQIWKQKSKTQNAVTQSLNFDHGDASLIFFFIMTTQSFK